nr:hypothetical protein [uncultured Anaerosporobacter sp.]
MTDIYYIGGSPCSGKSTVAEIIAQKYGIHYYKVDDYFESFTIKGAKLHYPICTKQTELSPEQIWMRDSVLQNEEEFQYYHEIFEFIQTDLLKYNEPRPIITEGAAYLPELMRQHNVTKDRYIAITPTKDFQISRYKKREWVPFVLEGCSDTQKAFENWMDRDLLFAQEVRHQCQVLNYSSILIDGTIAVDKIVSLVCAHFNLEA